MSSTSNSKFFQAASRKVLLAKEHIDVDVKLKQVEEKLKRGYEKS